MLLRSLRKDKARESIVVRTGCKGLGFCEERGIVSYEVKSYNLEEKDETGRSNRRRPGLWKREVS